jgi:hypothetical protein
MPDAYTDFWGDSDEGLDAGISTSTLVNTPITLGGSLSPGSAAVVDQAIMSQSDPLELESGISPASSGSSFLSDVGNFLGKIFGGPGAAQPSLNPISGAYGTKAVPNTATAASQAALAKSAIGGISMNTILLIAVGLGIFFVFAKAK